MKDPTVPPVENRKKFMFYDTEINHEQEKNCTFESIRRNDCMTLREVGERLNISYVRVKQIQDKTLKKISHLLK